MSNVISHLQQKELRQVVIYFYFLAMDYFLHEKYLHTVFFANTPSESIHWGILYPGATSPGLLRYVHKEFLEEKLYVFATPIGMLILSVSH